VITFVIHHSTSHLHEAELQLENDINTAQAKIGTTSNIHYVCSACQGTPTLLSSFQIAWLCKKKGIASKGGKTPAIVTGKIDDIYKFLEDSGNYHVSLLARDPTFPDEQAKNATEKQAPTGTVTLFNKTHIGNCTGLEDVSVYGESADQERLWVVGDHCRVLKIADSKEMMVAIAYGMPFELFKFGVFNASLHIDTTSDTNKEGLLFVTVTSKDSYGKMLFVIHIFLPSEHSWAYKWLFQTVLPVLIGQDVLNKVSLVVTDGDSQEITQLEDLVNRYFPGVYCIHCSWHIINRGWHKQVKVPLGGH
jgi:hypothetical protein